MKKLKIKSRAQRIFFAYETEKLVQINSKKIGLIYRVLQLLILTYIIGYVMIYMNGYQESFGLTSGVVTKLKGVSHVGHRNDIPRKVWDIPDAIVPAEEHKSVFITTNAVFTPNQTQSKCPESYEIDEAQCNNDSDCVEDQVFIYGNGVATGKCVLSGHNPSRKTCEIKAWCPIENDNVVKVKEPMFLNILNYTLFIRNTVQFDNLDLKRTNLFLWENGEISTNCQYNPNHPTLKYCPIFPMSAIIGNISDKEKIQLLRYGGVFQIIITWNCDLNFDPKYCKPEFSFNRLDNPSAHKSRGWNFRYPIYFFKGNKEFRNLYKVFGLRILVEVRGRAMKFSFVIFSMNLGSGLSYFAVAVVICDFIILYMMPNRKNYADFKFELFEDDDAYEDSECGSTLNVAR